MGLYSEYSEEKLFLLITAGDDHAFAEVYERFWERLFRHALRMLQDQHYAQDIVQDTFISLWQKRQTLHSDGKLSALLYKTLRNKVFDFLDYSKVRSDYITALTLLGSNGSGTADDRVRERELVAAVEREIEQMPVGMRTVFELSRTQHLSYKEIAMKLHISENTVKVQISRALGKLRKVLFSIFILTSVTILS